MVCRLVEGVLCCTGGSTVGGSARDFVGGMGTSALGEVCVSIDIASGACNGFAATKTLLSDSFGASIGGGDGLTNIGPGLGESAA